MPPAKHFSFLRTVTRVHDYLDELFLEHQILLMRSQLQEAFGILNQLIHHYQQHIKDEESLLLPLYKKKVNPIPQGGAIEFFIREHRQIMQILTTARDELRTWNSEGKIAPLKLVSLFDRYYTLRDLLNHHHAREDTFLYRLLDRKTDDSSQGKIISKFSLLPEHTDP